MPYVTEELFQRLAILAGNPRATIMTAPYPTPGGISALKSPRAEGEMRLVTHVAGCIRSQRAAYLKVSEIRPRSRRDRAEMAPRYARDRETHPRYARDREIRPRCGAASPP